MGKGLEERLMEAERRLKTPEPLARPSTPPGFAAALANHAQDAQRRDAQPAAGVNAALGIDFQTHGNVNLQSKATAPPRTPSVISASVLSEPVSVETYPETVHVSEPMTTGTMEPPFMQSPSPVRPQAPFYSPFDGLGAPGMFGPPPPFGAAYPAADPSPPLPPPLSFCSRCGAPLGGAFCSICGQQNMPVNIPGSSSSGGLVPPPVLHR